MIAWLFRRVVRMGLRWLVVSAAARWVIGRFGRRRVDAVVEELEAAADERLPAPVARIVNRLPPEAKQLGGSAVVAGRAARTTAAGSRRAVAIAGQTSRRVAAVPGSARHAIERVKDETEASGRRLRAQYLAETVGPDAATDALLDVRTEPPAGSSRRSDAMDEVDQLHDSVPGPVARGRRRFRPRAVVPVGRMQRTYRRPTRPW